MIPIQLKLAIAGVLALSVVTIIGLGYSHYTGLLETVEVLRTDNAVLAVAVETQGDTIDAQTQAIAEWQTAQDALVLRMEEAQRVAQVATEETRRLNGIFARHNLTELSARRPGLIERRINDGSSRLGRLLECASGAERADCADGDSPTD